jgi:glycerate dehydrogenase
MNIVYLDAASVASADLSPLEVLGDLNVYPYTTPEEAMERIVDAHVIITNKVKIGQGELDVAPNLKLVIAAATGMDHIDKEACAARGVKTDNVRSYSTESVAQWTLTAVLTLLMRPNERDVYCKSGAYSQSGNWTMPTPTWSELKGKRWGIIGYGTIGRRVQVLAQAFGCEVVFFSPSGNRASDIEQLPLDELLSTSDVVSIHAPGVPRYLGLLNQEKLSLLKQSALLISVGRGGIVDEHAVAKMLDDASLAGAAFDVYAEEPFAEGHPFLNMTSPERLLLTPHMAWTSQEALRNLIGGLADGVRKIS